MKYRIITLIGLAGSTLAVCFGGWDKFLQTLLLFMAIDWFTGGILLPAVIIGDSLTSDIQGGINAGIRTIWFNPSHEKTSEIIPDHEFDSLMKLPELLSHI